MRSVKLFSKSISVLAIAIIISAGMVGAALLDYYGKITTTVDVEQSVLVDGKDHTTPIIDEISEPALGGETFCFHHWLHNQASVPTQVAFETIYAPELEDDEIVTTYWLPVKYSETFEVDNAVVTVENLECSVKWTIDMTENTGLYQSPFKNGHAAVALVIGVDGDILYQVHSNDGTCAAHPWGTWLLSFYDQTGGGWYGWHSSDPDWNKPVAEYGIVCTGERDYADNPTYLYTITIPKQLLSCGEFEWALVLIGDYTFAKIEPTYEWSDTDTTNFVTAKVGIPVPEPLVLPPCIDIHFTICHSFDIAIKPRIYRITTTIVPT